MLTRFWHVLFQGRSCSKRLACKPGVGGRGGGGGGGLRIFGGSMRLGPLNPDVTLFQIKIWNFPVPFFRPGL